MFFDLGVFLDAITSSLPALPSLDAPPPPFPCCRSHSLNPHWPSFMWIMLFPTGFLGGLALRWYPRPLFPLKDPEHKEIFLYVHVPAFGLLPHLRSWLRTHIFFTLHRPFYSRFFSEPASTCTLASRSRPFFDSFLILPNSQPERF